MKMGVKQKLTSEAGQVPLHLESFLGVPDAKDLGECLEAGILLLVSYKY
ncbi:hypothetical protein [Rufibacter tibetensis]|nr:hypothetical protein [Rufibacter tibetensis]